MMAFWCSAFCKESGIVQMSPVSLGNEIWVLSNFRYSCGWSESSPGSTSPSCLHGNLGSVILVLSLATLLADWKPHQWRYLQLPSSHLLHPHPLEGMVELCMKWVSPYLLSGQAESHLMLPVKVTHKKQTYPGCSAQGSLPRVHSEWDLSKKVVGCVYRRIDFVWSYSRVPWFPRVLEGNSVLCSFPVWMPPTHPKSSACMHTQPYWCVHCSPRQYIHSLQQWSTCPLLLRWLSLDTAYSFTFLNKVKCFTMGNFCFFSGLWISEECFYAKPIFMGICWFF